MTDQTDVSSRPNCSCSGCGSPSFCGACYERMRNKSICQSIEDSDSVYAAEILLSISVSTSQLQESNTKNRYATNTRRPSIADMRALMDDLGPTTKKALFERKTTFRESDDKVKKIFPEWFPNFLDEFRYDEKKRKWVPKGGTTLHKERRRRKLLRI